MPKHNNKKEFKLIRNTDKRKHSYKENSLCINCKLDDDYCKCNIVCREQNVYCNHCNYDYTNPKGMLFDEYAQNRTYIMAFKKWQQKPCQYCDKNYTNNLYQITNWAEEEWYENELMMQKIDVYLVDCY
jgi:hypothetical protein